MCICRHEGPNRCAHGPGRIYLDHKRQTYTDIRRNKWVKTSESESDTPFETRGSADLHDHSQPVGACASSQTWVICRSVSTGLSNRYKSTRNARWMLSVDVRELLDVEIVASRHGLFTREYSHRRSGGHTRVSTRAKLLWLAQSSSGCVSCRT